MKRGGERIEFPTLREHNATLEVGNNAWEEATFSVSVVAEGTPEESRDDNEDRQVSLPEQLEEDEQPSGGIIQEEASGEMSEEGSPRRITEERSSAVRTAGML